MEYIFIHAKQDQVTEKNDEMDSKEKRKQDEINHKGNLKQEICLLIFKNSKVRKILKKIYANL